MTENRNEWLSLGLNTSAPLGENWVSKRRAVVHPAGAHDPELRSQPVLDLAVAGVVVVAPVVVGQVHQGARGVHPGVPVGGAVDHPAAIGLEVPVLLALEVEDVGPLLQRQRRTTSEY